jgi:hypothetical protein
VGRWRTAGAFSVVAVALLLLGGGCGAGSDSQVGEGAEEADQVEEGASECDPNYSGGCLDPYASDYDCEGGSGDGPKYSGPVTVVGEDHYDLDADGNGVGCEPE